MRDFGKQNTRRNVSKISGGVTSMCDVVPRDRVVQLRAYYVKVGNLVAWRESQSLRYAGHKVTWSLPGHIWPWALAQTSIFSKFNWSRNKLQTELLYNCDGFICFQHIEAWIILAVLNWIKSLK